MRGDDDGQRTVVGDRAFITCSRMPMGTSDGGRLRGGGAFADDNGGPVAGANGRTVNNEGNLILGSTSGIANNDNTEDDRKEERGGRGGYHAQH